MKPGRGVGWGVNGDPRGGQQHFPTVSKATAAPGREATEAGGPAPGGVSVGVPPSEWRPRAEGGPGHRQLVPTWALSPADALRASGF